MQNFGILHSAFYILIILSFLPLRAQSTLDSPLYLGTILIEEPNVEAMSQTCERYGLTSSADTIGGYNAYTHPDGTLIRFKMNQASNGRAVPLIEITTKLSAKQVGKILERTGYEKTKDGYAKGSAFANRRTSAKISHDKNKPRLLITKSYRQ